MNLYYLKTVIVKLRSLNKIMIEETYLGATPILSIINNVFVLGILSVAFIIFIKNL